MIETATSILQDIGLADRYPSKYHSGIYNVLFNCTIEGPRAYLFANWFNNYLRKQARLGDQTEDYSLDCATLMAAAISYPKIRKYQSIIDIDYDTLASVAYIRSQLGPNADAYIHRSERYNYSVIWLGIQAFTNRTALTDMFNRTIKAYSVETAALKLYAVHILYAHVPTDGRETKFKFMFCECRHTWGYERTCWSAITDLTKKSLQEGTAYEPALDAWRDGTNTLWDVLKRLGVATEAEAKVLLLSTFSKQKLLFDYLLCLTPAGMDELCTKHQGISTHLLSPTGRLPTSRLQKLNLACNWSSPLLLDLIGIDALTITDNAPIDNLMMPKQISFTPLDIEI
ncbi:Hypothetical protein MVR_LOCUS266 [uncultured virus]|nr:Hypothetical protein MVR_LOCUS266 [uncultured virus]